jgi:hypothetical protein
MSMDHQPIFNAFGNKLILLFITLSLFSCRSTSPEKASTIINLDHLKHLSQNIDINNQNLKIVNIYADYPDYQTVEAPGEGIACVDDVARAAIFYLKHYKFTQKQSSLDEAKGLLDFILFMQAPNGMFNNFIYSDLSINKTHQNSIAQANWWTWRAIWALSEGCIVFQDRFPNYAQKLSVVIDKTLPAIDSLLQQYPKTKVIKGLILPTWFPSGTASDQAALIIIGLVSYYNIKRDPKILDYIKKMSDGIVLMGYGVSLKVPYGCFLSWENLWHAYGNSQAYALLLASEVLNNEIFKNKALNEIDNFYPFLSNRNYLNSFKLYAKEEGFEIAEVKEFPQISYNIRPMIWACLKAYEMTGSQKYAVQAGELACWLLGKNITKQALYNPLTGRCFDGINDKDNLNKNSGAESTIESLLSLLVVERNPISKKILLDYYSSKRRD